MRARGFTLLEVIIAIAIFAVISAIAYATLSNILNTRDSLDRDRTYWRALSLTFLRIEEDLSYIRDRKVRDNDGMNFVDAIKGQGSNIKGSSDPDLEFTRGGVINFQGVKSDLLRVGYRRTEGKVLMRMVWPVLDRATDTKPKEIALLENVEEFTIEYFYDGGTSNSWPIPSQIPGAPVPALRGIEIRIALADGKSYNRLFAINN